MKVKEFKLMVMGDRYIVYSARTGKILEKNDWKAGSTNNLEVIRVFARGIEDNSRFGGYIVRPTICLYVREE